MYQEVKLQNARAYLLAFCQNLIGQQKSHGQPQSQCERATQGCESWGCGGH